MIDRPHPRSPETEINLSTDTAVATHCDIYFGSGPPYSAPTHSESHKTFSLMVTASTVGNTNMYPSLFIYPASTRTWEEAATPQISGLRKTSNSQDASSALDRNIIFSQVASAATNEVITDEFTSSDRISSPGFTTSQYL